MSVRPSPPGPAPTGTAVPRPGAVAEFPPIFAGRGRFGRRLRRALRPRRLVVWALTLCAAGAAAAAALTPPPSGGAARASPVAHSAPPSRPADAKVSAPVRLADAAAVGLLRAGDRVDVIATGSEPHVVARCVRVEQVPQPDGATRFAGDGGLVVLRLTRGAATELAGAGTSSPLAVALC